MRALLKVALGTVLSASALTAGVAAPAQATPSFDGGANRVCMWEDENYGGSKYDNGTGKLACIRPGHGAIFAGWNDNMAESFTIQTSC